MKKSVVDVVAVAECILGLVDLTTLNDDDSVSTVTHLCHQAKSPAGNTAAVCIYPRFIPVARKVLHDQGTPEIRIATVTNFPHGDDNIEIALAQTRAAVAYGADEVDLVFPYRALMAGSDRAGYALVQACHSVCADSNVLLKVIIETGELKQASLIQHACEIAIDAGADFLKTSTGKVALNATLPAAEIMLSVIRDKGVHERVGFKAAGGIRTLADAAAFLQLAENMMGKAWINPRHLRFGASSLLSDLLVALGYQK